jgi:hypothetical protein
MRVSLIIAITLITTIAANAQIAPQPSNTWLPAPAPPGVNSPSDPLAVPSPTQPAAPAAAPMPERGRSQPGRSLGLEQKAWQNPQQHMSKRQSRPGFIRYSWRPDEIMQVNLREGLISVVKFPSNEEILQVISSDPSTFETIIAPNKRSFVMRSIYAGVDGNVIAYGTSGNVYNFYVRSLVFNANVLPDTTVEISVGGMSTNTGETVTSQQTAAAGGDQGGFRSLFTPASARAVRHFEAGGREYARGAPLDPNSMRANVVIKAPTAADSAIAPIRAWHDGRFTYLDFGPHASSMVQWPVAALLVQGVESPVGTRVTGRDRSMMIVEAVGSIVLRNGQYIVCLIAEFPKNDTRYAVDPPIENHRANPHAGKTIRAPAAALTYDQRNELTTQRQAVEAQTTAAIERRRLAEAQRGKLEAETAARRAETDARMARERQDNDARKAAQAAEAEQRRVEASRPPPAPGRLAATLGPLSSSDGSAIMRDMERKNGRVIKALALQWQDDRGSATSVGALRGPGYLRVDGLSSPLAQELCATARQRNAGCSTIH